MKLNLNAVKGTAKSLTAFKGHRAALVARKYAPNALVGAGIVGMTAGTVLACRQTLKLEEVITPHVNDLQRIKKSAAELPLETYSSVDKQQDTIKVYTRIVVDAARLYAVPAAMMGLSAAAILGGHKITLNRNAGLAAVVATTDKAFADYRKRVIEKYGENADVEMRHGFTEGTHKVKNEEGKEVTHNTFAPKKNGELSRYARFFDESCAKWSKIPEYNQMFVAAQQDYANDMLKARGHLFLNEVYDCLGLPRTREGAIVGWVQNGGGDGFVDFGIYDSSKAGARDFVNGYERSVLLDFNVDGPILDLI